MSLFRKLLPEEEKRFRQWARENYRPLDPINGVWHPVVQDECRRMNECDGCRQQVYGGTWAPPGVPIAHTCRDKQEVIL